MLFGSSKSKERVTLPGFGAMPGEVKPSVLADRDVCGLTVSDSPMFEIIDLPGGVCSFANPSSELVTFVGPVSALKALSDSLEEHFLK
jgi:hypothetical protein